MSSFEELVRECDRLWLNCRCTRLRLTPVKKQVQKDNRRKAVELKADWETFYSMLQKIWRMQGGKRKWTDVFLLCFAVNPF